MKTSDVLKACRIFSKMSQREVARKAGVSSNIINRLEHGTGTAYITTVERILNAMGYRLMVVKSNGERQPKPFNELRQYVTDINVNVIADHLKDEDLFNWCGYMRAEMMELIRRCEGVPDNEVR